MHFALVSDSFGAGIIANRHLGDSSASRTSA